MRKIIVFPNQRVITTGGEVVTVAFTRNEIVFAYGKNGMPRAVVVCGDAWGGKVDQELGLVA